MFRQMRTAPSVRAALLAAGALAVLASFGLHPERLGDDQLAAHRGLASAHADKAPHACPACLTHGAALAPRLSELPARAAVFAPALPPPDVLPPGRLAGRDLSGRSPPDRS
jgi:hypothetical protein